MPVEAGDDLYDRGSVKSAAKALEGPMSGPGDAAAAGDALKITGTRDAAKQQTVAGAPSLDLSDLPDPQGMSEPEEKMVASKPKPFRFDQNPMQESKQLDRMKLLAGMKKKDK